MILKYGLRGLSKTQVCAQASACFSTRRCQKQAIGQRPMSSATSPEFKEISSQKWHLTEPSIRIQTRIPGKILFFFKVMLKIGFQQSNKNLF